MSCTATACGGDDLFDAEEAGSPHSRCDPALQDCDRPCAESTDCERGYACLPSKTSEDADEPTHDAAVPDGGAGPLTGSMDASVLDARVDNVRDIRDANAPTPPRLRRYCSAKCDDAECGPGQACTSSYGSCYAYCRSDGDCAAETYCNLADGRCLLESGACERNEDCSLRDVRLSAMCMPTCVDEHCRITPSGQGAPLRHPNLPELTVEAPAPGARIDSPIGEYAFVTPFVEADTVVLVISSALPNDLRALLDDPTTALWAAYVTPARAAQGVRLAEGGWFDVGSRWRRDASLSRLATLQDRALYFIAFAFRGTRPVSASVPVPFSVGSAYREPRDACDVDDSLCLPAVNPLICYRGACHVPCLSAHDCSYPLTCRRVHGLTSKICL